MPERLVSFLVVFLLMFRFSGKGQIRAEDLSSVKLSLPIKSGSYTPYRFRPGIFSGAVQNIHRNFPVVNLCTEGLLQKKRPVFTWYEGQDMPSWYINGLGFICKKEWELEKFTHIPFRFRLGSLDYVNRMEQKPGY